MRFDFVIPVLQHLDDIQFYDGLATRLERRGCSVALIPLSREGEVRLKAHHEHVFYLYEGFSKQWRCDAAEAIALEDKYGMNWGDEVFTEQGYFGETIEALTFRGVFTMRFLERFIREHDVRSFINNQGGEIVRRVMTYLARSNGFPNINLEFTPFHGRMALSTKDIQWDELPDEPPPLTASERDFIVRYVADATAKRKPFAHPAPLGMNLGSLYRPFVNVAKSLVSTEHRDGSLKDIYVERARQAARSVVNPRLYQEPVDGDRYFFFPLHVTNDSAITVRAPQFRRQEDLVEYIANHVLPTGAKLYVKPHPGGLYCYSIPMMARISRMRGVRIVGPTHNSHDLIAGSAAVIVINSTVGFEALFHGKPVVSLGRVFYRGYGATRDVDYVADLPAAVREALTSPPDRERVLRFLHACYKVTFEAQYNNRSDENLELMSAALVAKLGRLESGSKRSAAAAASIGNAR